MTIAKDDVTDKEHDKGYRDILSNKDAFLHVLKKYIGEPWTKDISPDDIEQVKTSFVLPEYKDLDSDLIYKMKKGDDEVYFYVLLELQSKVDFTMPFRLLQYMVALLTDRFKNTPEAIRERKGFRLPAVVPIVLYNGEDNWTAVRSYREYTKDYELFGDNIIDFTYHLFDIRRTDKSKILTGRKFPDQIIAFDRERFDKIDVDEMAGVLREDTPSMTDEELAVMSRWLSRSVFIGVNPANIKDTFLQTIKRGDAKPMKHGITVFMEKKFAEKELMARLDVARKLLLRGDSVDDVVEVTGLELNDVLKLKGEI